MVGSPPANAGDAGSIPGPGGSHMPRSDWARGPQLLEPARLEPMLCSRGGHRSGRPADRNGEWPPLSATRERPQAAAKTQCSQK